MNPTQIITSAAAGVALVGSVLVGTGQVASNSELKSVEAMALDTSNDVHGLKTEQAVMRLDIEYIKKSADIQNAKLNKIIETLSTMQAHSR